MEQKKMYDVFISYSHRDGEFVEQVMHCLEARGVSVFKTDEIMIEANMRQKVADAIRSARVFVPLVTEHSIQSYACMAELELAISVARDRSKTILPVCFSKEILSDSPEIQYYLARYRFGQVDPADDKAAEKMAEEIAQKILGEKTEKELYEKATEYLRVGAVNRAVPVLCRLALDTCDKICGAAETKKVREMYSDLLLLLQKIWDIYDYDYGPEAKTLAEQKMEVVNRTGQLLKREEFQAEDLYYVSAALRLIYFDREIRWACIDAATHGDLSDGIIRAVPVSDYIKKQEKYRERYYALLKQGAMTAGAESRYSEQESQIIRDTKTYIYTGKEVPLPIRINKEMSGSAKEKDRDDQLLHSVASFMKEGNKVFDLMSEYQGAEEFLRCLILSYERLKAYCEVVGEKEVCAECIDRIVELKRKLENRGEVKETPEKVEKGIKTLLGLTVPKSGVFDVFISHKREDMDIASDMYHFLKRNMKEAFFDKYSLPEMSKAQYRNAIMEALDGSRHFVVVFSDLSYLESDWVKLEMEIFQSEMDEGRKENANFLMVVTDGVYNKIMESNKSVLPIAYRRCEIMRVEEYSAKLLKYL